MAPGSLTSTQTPLGPGFCEGGTVGRGTPMNPLYLGLQGEDGSTGLRSRTPTAELHWPFAPPVLRFLRYVPVSSGTGHCSSQTFF